MNTIKFTLFFIFCSFTFCSQTQILNFELSLQDGVYKGNVRPDYFDSLMIKPSGSRDKPLLNATGVLFNSEHGDFNFRISKNIIDRSTELLFKVSFGWFPINNLILKGDRLTFSWDWDYRPPPNATGLKILLRANDILRDENAWDSKDDRQCENDRQNEKWSLYCALYRASFDVIEDFNHRNSAMEMVRKTIDEVAPKNNYQHRLMDFNNKKSFADVKSVLDLSIEKFEVAMSKN